MRMPFHLHRPSPFLRTLWAPFTLRLKRPELVEGRLKEKGALSERREKGTASRTGTVLWGAQGQSRPLGALCLTGVSLLAVPGIARAGHCDVAGSSGITLMEPIGDAHCFYGSADALTMISAYLGTLLPWLLGLCATYCVLMVALGGAEIIISGGNESLKEGGKKRIIYAIVGLVLLTFSATILNFLNASFFT